MLDIHVKKDQVVNGFEIIRIKYEILGNKGINYLFCKNIGMGLKLTKRKFNENYARVVMNRTLIEVRILSKETISFSN